MVLKALVLKALRDKHLLLVLDNFEHVLGAASYVAELGAQCAHVGVDGCGQKLAEDADGGRWGQVVRRGNPCHSFIND